MIGQFTPQLRATGDVNPYRFVEMSGDNQGAQAGAAAVDVVGVSDGDSKAFDSDLHAQSGDPIRLQAGKVVFIETAAAGVAAGGRVNSDANGRAVAVGALGAVNGILLQASGVNAIVQMFMVESFIAAT